MRRRFCTLQLLAVTCAMWALAFGSQAASETLGVDPSLYSGLHWRSIGPYRGGRAVAVSGVSGDPRTYYFGAVGGGVWKTGNAGVTWHPVMEAVASVGAIAVAPSDPSTVYVGSGEADMRSDIIHGNGMYRSTDAGATWTHVGLEDSRQIGRILVAPGETRTLLVAALGHAYGPNATRGVYRSTDGGATWARTLAHDDDTGAVDLASDPAMRVVFASLWQTRRPPWSVYPPSNGPGSGLYRSRDGGVTWSPVRGHGFPAAAVGKIGLAVAPSDPQRVYAIVDAKAGGLYRSDDGGITWRLLSGEKRLWNRGWYFCHVAVDPKNPDSVYVSDTALYHSTDGGAHFAALKGSPDGDDFHQLWIDPLDASRMVLGSDQGASVSVDLGHSWSSWFNQPTGQFYHVATDNAFPYRLYGAQQDNGAARILSRSDHRGIEERDWRPLGAGGESGSIAPDPNDAEIVYGTNSLNSDGAVLRENLRTNQTRTITPTVGKPDVWRREWTQPITFGIDGALYVSFQSVFRSRDGGNHWDAVSGDLSRPHAGVPATLDAPAAADADGPEPRGVVYALASSPRTANVLWAGTDDGLLYLTTDAARTWRDVTPSTFTPWSHVDGIEASHFGAGTAYVALDRHRLDDDRPYVYITHDAGTTWRESHVGIPDDSFVNVVREDPVRKGLLYAGTETGVYVSFDDATSWQSLRANMPVVSVRDISVHDGDLAIATHGRGFWILDDIEPLRELAVDARLGARLFAPRDAIRMRAANNEAEIAPPETPLGENPASGAFVDYFVPIGARGPLALRVTAPTGETVCTWSSENRSHPVDAASLPFTAHYSADPQVLVTQPGMHRFVWNFYLDCKGGGVLAAPGRYGVVLTLAGKTFTQSLVVRRDPRIAASDADLVAQMQLARAVETQREHVAAELGSLTKSHRARNARVAMRIEVLKVREELLAGLTASIESADASPSEDERAAWEGMRREI